MNKKPIVALAQIKYFDKSTTNNLNKILYYIRRAKEEHADIVCFPESCLHKKDSLKINHEIIKNILEECKKNSIWCIITDDIQKKNKKIYNTAILIDRNGKMRGEYKKIHLYGDKTSAGNKAFVFKTDFGKIGIAICWDLAFPGLFRRMKSMGAQIVFCPSMWEGYDLGMHNDAKREFDILKSLVLSRAYENIFFVALCNPTKNSRYLIPYSVICSPTKVLKEIKSKEGLIVQKINLEEIKKLHEIHE
ncbi:MAG: carbon-nitrogen hydrolase family protein [Nanoarchaeota archaeon]|nr:carbon-nitrogen hydrolase family protein [Nanoarchaeota archaeon]